MVKSRVDVAADAAVVLVAKLLIIPTSSSTELTACDENPTCLLFPADLALEADVCFLRL